MTSIQNFLEQLKSILKKILKFASNSPEGKLALVELQG